jgi:hypothetical protein
MWNLKLFFLNFFPFRIVNSESPRDIRFKSLDNHSRVLDSTLFD